MDKLNDQTLQAESAQVLAAFDGDGYDESWGSKGGDKG